MHLQLGMAAIKLQENIQIYGLPKWLSGKESAANARDLGLIPGSARSPGEENGNSL